MSATEFQVTGMTCSHCEASVREEVAEVPGVGEIRVDAATGTLVVEAKDPSGSVDPAAVVAAVAEAGYTAVTRR